jgi:hypothetical protein
LASAFSVYFVAERISAELSSAWHLLYAGVVVGTGLGCHYLRQFLKGRMALTLMAIVLGTFVNVYIYFRDELAVVRYLLLGVAMGVLMYLGFSLKREVGEPQEGESVI